MPEGLNIQEDDSFFTPADDEHVAREKRKARDLRQSQWWKNQLGHCVCYYCGRHFKPSELTMDHIVPIIRGGFTRRGNVVPCCKECNRRKKYLLPVEWQDYLQQLNKPTTPNVNNNMDGQGNARPQASPKNKE